MTLDELINQVVVDVPDAPLMTISDQIKRAGRDFCTQADAWIQVGYAVAGATTDYPRVIANQGEPLRVIELFDGEKEVPASKYRQVSPRVLEFSETPENDLLTGKVACRPSPHETPPAELLERWGETVADGARWRLLLMPQPWRDPKLAAYYEQSFRSAITDAKRLSRLGHNQARNRVRARPFL